MDGTVASIRSGMSVYIRMTARGKIAQTIVMQIIMPYVSLSMRLTMEITLSCLPSPIMLLTSVLHVDENAARTIQNRPDMLLAILDMANARSPRDRKSVV